MQINCFYPGVTHLNWQDSLTTIFPEPLLATTNPAVGRGGVSGPSRSVHSWHRRSYAAWAHDIWRPHSFQHSSTEMSKKWSTTRNTFMSPIKVLLNETNAYDNEMIHAKLNTLFSTANETLIILTLFCVI